MARIVTLGSQEFEVVSQYEGGIDLLLTEDGRWYLYWQDTGNFMRFATENKVWEYAFRMGLELKPIKNENNRKEGAEEQNG